MLPVLCTITLTRVCVVYLILLLSLLTSANKKGKLTTVKSLAGDESEHMAKPDMYLEESMTDNKQENGKRMNGDSSSRNIVEMHTVKHSGKTFSKANTVRVIEKENHLMYAGLYNTNLEMRNNRNDQTGVHHARRIYSSMHNPEKYHARTDRVKQVLAKGNKSVVQSPDNSARMETTRQGGVGEMNTATIFDIDGSIGRGDTALITDVEANVSRRSGADTKDKIFRQEKAMKDIALRRKRVATKRPKALSATAKNRLKQTVSTVAGNQNLATTEMDAGEDEIQTGDPCANKPCQLGGTCKSLKKRTKVGKKSKMYMCKCPVGTHGDKCEHGPSGKCSDLENCPLKSKSAISCEKKNDYKKLFSDLPEVYTPGDNYYVDQLAVASIFLYSDDHYCLCSEGMHGPTCKSKCSADHWGKLCVLRCANCKKSKCDRISGKCKKGCNNGWRGPRCVEKAVCRTKTKTCKHGFCKDDEQVRIEQKLDDNHQDCICQVGWEGVYCNKKCENHEWGFMCLNTCGKCKSSKSLLTKVRKTLTNRKRLCNIKDGTCKACKEGYVLPLCLRRTAEETKQSSEVAVQVHVEAEIVIDVDAADAQNMQDMLATLQADWSRLREENNELLGENNQLQGQNSELIDETNQLLEDQKRLQGENNLLQGENSLLKGETNRLQGEKDKLSEDKDKSEAEKSRLQSETNELLEKKDQLVRENVELQGQRDQLADDKAKLQNETDKLTVEKAEIQGERDQLADDKAKIQKEKDELASENALIQREKDQLEKEKQELSSTNRHLRVNNTKVVEENEVIKEQVAMEMEETWEMNKKLFTKENQNALLNRAYERLEKNWTKIMNTNAGLLEKIQELTNSLGETRAENNRLLTEWQVIHMTKKKEKLTKLEKVTKQLQSPLKKSVQQHVGAAAANGSIDEGAKKSTVTVEIQHIKRQILGKKSRGKRQTAASFVAELDITLPPQTAAQPKLDEIITTALKAGAKNVKSDVLPSMRVDPNSIKVTKVTLPSSSDSDSVLGISAHLLYALLAVMTGISMSVIGVWFFLCKPRRRQRAANTQRVLSSAWNERAMHQYGSNSRRPSLQRSSTHRSRSREYTPTGRGSTHSYTSNARESKL